MLPRERLLTTLQHREPDHVPYDLGSTQVTGIHTLAYQALRKHLGLAAIEPELSDTVQGLALPAEEDLVKLGADVRGLFPRCSHNWGIRNEDAVDYWAYQDEWGIVHHKPKDNGLYYSAVKFPIDNPDLSVDEMNAYQAPDFTNPERITGLRELATKHRAAGYAVLMKDPFAGLFEMGQRLRGMENMLMDLAANEELSSALLDRLLDLKLDFWRMALTQMGDLIDVVSMSDDYGTQVSQLLSPATYRRQLKPRMKILLAEIKKQAPHINIFFHSCGNVRPLIPDFIEIGVNILNPVHIRATGMEPVALKRDFGKDICFWGGGVDTQFVLPQGTPAEIRDHVKRNIEALAPGGGFVFNPIHNIQADVPPQNIIAMWEAWRDFGKY